MSVAKNIEITASSTKSFDDAISSGILRASQSLDEVKGAWVKEQKVSVSKGKITEYRVTMIVTFVLAPAAKKAAPAPKAKKTAKAKKK